MSEINRNKSDFYLGTNAWPSNDFNGIKLRELSALRTATAIYGSDIKIDVSKENPRLKEFIRALDDDVNFLDFMYGLERLIHIYGASIVLVTAIGDPALKKYKWVIPAPFGSNYNYMFYNDLESVKVTCLINRGNQTACYAMFDYTKDYLRIDGFADQALTQNVNDKNTNDVARKEFNDFITRNRLRPYQKNITGEVPALLIKNRNTIAGFNTAFSEFLPEGSHAQGFQALMNQAVATLMYELRANVTRIFLRLSKAEIDTIKSNLSLKQLHGFYNAGVYFAERSSAGLTGDNTTSWMEIQEGNPKLDLYLGAIREIKNIFLDSIELSESKNTEGLRTATEIRTVKKNEYEIINLKRGLRTKFIKEMIIKTLNYHNGQMKYYGLDSEIIPFEESDFSVEINSIAEQDRSALIQEQIMLVNNGLQDRLSALKVIYNIKDEDAETKLDAIKTDQALIAQENQQNNPFNEEQEQQEPEEPNDEPDKNPDEPNDEPEEVDDE